MKRFYIKTLGCKVNHYESDGIATELINNGFGKAKTIKNAQICIINTCTVTSKAGRQSRQAIRKIIKSNPSTKVIVTGCHAQIEPEKIRAIENVDEIVSHKDKFKIFDALISKDLSKNHFSFPEPNRCRDTVFRSFEHVVKGEMTRAYLKIQDGCNSYCSYCIIPYARGPSRSMSGDEVISNLKGLYSQDFEEAILTGIHLGTWGWDFTKKSSLSELFQKIFKTKDIPRVRISSIEPNELTNDIIDFASNPAKLCDHFHIPLQSGDDEILRKMKRPYDTNFFNKLISKINKKLPNVSIGIDVIAGFPGETLEHFKNTFAFIKELEISYIHVFPYSPRKGTKAYGFSDKVNNNEIKSRCSQLRKLSNKKKKNFEKQMINKKLTAIIQTKRDKKTNLLVAMTSNYLSVLVEGKDDIKRKIIDIIPEKWDENKKLHGIIN